MNALPYPFEWRSGSVLERFRATKTSASAESGRIRSRSSRSRSVFGKLDFARVALQYHLMRTELVTTLKRQATDLLADIERDKKPILITQHGLPSAYLVDVESYQLQQDRMTILEGIARGEVAISEKRTLTQAQAEKRLGKWLK